MMCESSTRPLVGRTNLENVRIRSTCSDDRKSVVNYHEHCGAATKQERCLDQLYCIVPHHYGDHLRYKDVEYCYYLSVKIAHPDWSENQISAEVRNPLCILGADPWTCPKKAKPSS